ncbi:hypothetical protein AF335_01880 [Streptomyces eurocidicus]|uniref:Uncharacterized protein n=1 Tax=Streptomyces eurocidicus TaxID=66423 RepID=A0A2N8P2B3_STREU|nr:hypothetical protein [Streptomyces eurocidicus]MBB5121151.1 hypothetical protein [Streptomyces eurocidicus]MBF6054165.1 hypothetical protein [Streptomyces eurocidicus]PNE35157.1 hypothetical protein AF335_01880 [Streptomyces eurocidicus]
MADASRRTVRTIVQTAVALAVLLPAIIDASGIPSTLPWVAAALAVAGGLSRVMALPGVQALMPRWLRTGPDRDDELRRLDRTGGGGL